MGTSVVATRVGVGDGEDEVSQVRRGLFEMPSHALIFVVCILSKRALDIELAPSGQLSELAREHRGSRVPVQDVPESRTCTEKLSRKRRLPEDLLRGGGLVPCIVGYAGAQ